MRLLEAALASFAERGYHATSTRDIAEAAGMSPAAVYAHFETKEELLFRLSVDGHAEVLELVRAAASTSTKPMTRLHRVVAGFASWHARFPTQARVVQYEMAALTPEHAAEIASMRRMTQACVREVLEAGVADGVFVIESSRSVARAIVSLGIDVARWYDAAGRLTPEQIGAEYAAMSLRMAGCATDHSCV